MTIFALSTVEGQSGVAIIRVSGPLSKKTLKLFEQKAIELNPWDPMGALAFTK